MILPISNILNPVFTSKSRHASNMNYCSSRWSITVTAEPQSYMYRVAFLWTTFVTKVQHDLHLFKLAKLHFSMSMYWNLNCFPVCLYKILGRKKGNSFNEACLKLNNEYLQIIRRLSLNLITAYIKKAS